MVLDGVRHRDPVDDPPGHQFLQHPGKVARVDAVHGGAGADHGIQAEDGVLRVFRGEVLNRITVDEDVAAPAKVALERMLAARP